MKIKRCITALLALALLLFLPWAVMAAPVGKITNLQGNVDITVRGKAARIASPGDSVNVGDFIRTKSKSKAEITFNEGNILRLAENTRVGITEYMSGKKKNSSILNLFRGKIQNIVKTIGAITGGRYEVHTPTAVCGVRGTFWYNIITNQGYSETIVVEGSVSVHSANNPNAGQTVNAGQGAFIAGPSSGVQLRSVSSKQLDAMKNATEISGSSGNSGDSGGTGSSGGSSGSGSSGSYGNSGGADGTGTGDSGGTGSSGFTPPPPSATTSTYTPPIVVPPVNTATTSTTTTANNLNLNITPAGSFSHQIDEGGTITGQSSDGSTFNLTVSGAMTGTADDPAAGLISGKITSDTTVTSGDTSTVTESTVVSGVSGYMMGLPDQSRTTAKALIYSIYVNNDGQAGYLFSPDPMNATFSTSSFSGTGTAVKYAPAATSSFTPSTLALSVLTDLSLPAFGNIYFNPSGYVSLSCSNATCESEARGINVTGGKIGVWGAYSTSTGVTYSNAGGFTSFSNAKYINYDSDKKAALFSDNLTGAVDTAAKEVSIKGDFLYMSTLYKGSITMNHLGYYDASNIYTSISSGTIQLVPMAFANDLSLSLTDVSGIMGSATALWTNTSVPVTMIGTYSVPNVYNVLSGNWQSKNYLLGSGNLTNDSGGAYKGYLNTQLLLSSTNTISTDALALYVDASGNIGILRGNIPGSVYSSESGFKAEGELNRIEMATTTGIPAGTFVSSGTTSSSFTLSANVSNILSGGPSLNLNTLDSNWLDITGYNWGIGKIYSEGTYTGDPQGNAVFSYERSGSAGTESFFYTQLESSWSSGNGGYFLGNVAGASADWTSASTSVFGGTVKGVFNAATAATWYATALATRIETGDFVALAATAAGRAKLDSLNIPSVQVGSVDLSGSRGGVGDQLSVSMTGVNFYAYSSGAAPKIFATGNVTGSYDVSTLGGATPAAVNLTGSNGNNIAFTAGAVTVTPTVWDTTNGKWAAQVSGTGTVTSPATSITINGGAAGKLNNGSGGITGSLTGTASGTVR